MSRRQATAIADDDNDNDNADDHRENPILLLQPTNQPNQATGLQLTNGSIMDGKRASKRARARGVVSGTTIHSMTNSRARYEELQLQAACDAMLWILCAAAREEFLYHAATTTSPLHRSSAVGRSLKHRTNCIVRVGQK